ncbi:anaerobic sulfatase maturase [Sorangium sp. So ce296]|uniref:anaerobic sulfatase maturase n=1 Tax=Sorangium sp. So ce296 TaxID=3133296 RepID=UPI003F6054D3
MTPDQQTARAPFHVITKPIGAICNINCAYCFYLDKERLYDYPTRGSFRMADDVLERYVQQYIEAQPSTAEEVGFAWQGGEPTLMGLDFFRRAVELQKKHARPGQRVTNSLQTNGMLLDDAWCAFLRDEGFLVGISIDGPEPSHDRYRLDMEGRGTFKRVMKGLEAMKRSGVEFNTLTVVQRDNGDHGARVYRFLKEIGSRFMQLIPIVEHKDGKLSDRTVEPAQWGRFLTAVWDEWIAEDVGEIFVQHFDMMLGITMGFPSTLCVHARTCGRALAVEHNGDLYSCDHFVTPEHLLGNITKKRLSVLVDGPQQARFGQDKLDTLPRYCRECDHQKYCYGGCPAHRVKQTPDGEPGLNHLCEGYKMFYAHTVPALRAMAAAIRLGGTARDYRHYMPRERSATVRAP